MRLALVFVIVIHGLIHLIGFARAFGLITVSEFTHPVSKLMGLIWLLATVAMLLVSAAILFGHKWWWILALAAVTLSQILILGQWQDAKFGTFLNVIILMAALIGLAEWKFYNTYSKDVQQALNKAIPEPNNLITDADLLLLPPPVQKYLRYVGVVNTPKLKNVKIEFNGEMRGKTNDWFPFQSEQYNTFDIPHRLFFMRGKMKGFNVPGYHAFKDGHASMTIKLFSMIPVIHKEGDKLDIAETVTVFNDMCIMAPASLIDPRIEWEEKDSLSVQATFTNKGITISAELFFNEKGQLINFISDDRYEMTGKTPLRLRFSTPMSSYKNFNGINVPSYGEAIWHYPEGEFVYGKFYLKDIQYNVK